MTTRQPFFTWQRVPVLIATALAAAAIVAWALQADAALTVALAGVSAATLAMHAAWLYATPIRMVSRYRKHAFEVNGVRIRDPDAILLIREIAVAELILVAVLAGVIVAALMRPDWHGTLRWNAAGVGLIVAISIVAMTVKRYTALR